MKTAGKSVSILFGIAAFFVMFATNIHATTITINEEEAMTYGDQIDAIMETILDKYLDTDEITADVLYEAAMSGMFGVLDKYSDYIPASDSENYTNSLNNTYVGIGVQLVQENDYVVVTRVFLKGPAEEAGVKIHDKIIAVEGASIVGKTPQDAARLILGEEGTDVVITIDRSGYIFDVTITRGTVIINTVDKLDISEAAPDIPKEVAEKIGYLKIESFTSAVDEELAPILEAMKNEGKTHLLLDLRDNGGGYVDSGVAVCDMLLPEGPVLRFINNEGREIVYSSEHPSPGFEIVALVNDNSASATEFVSKAIQESGVGVLVGETTFGKGVAQYLYNLNDGAMIKLTQEQFYSGMGEPINGIGVKPDIKVSVPGYLTVSTRFMKNDTDLEVATVEELLAYLGYDVDLPDSLYDWKTVEAVQQFQADHGLYAYGVCDLTTQKAMNLALIESINANDIQLEKAIETITAMVEEEN